MATACFLLVCLSFIFGISFGTSTDYKSFQGTFIPVLSLVGSWVSGLATVAAVYVALWSTQKQLQSDREFLKIDFNFVLIGGQGIPVLAITAVSTGKRPSEINSVSIYSSNASIRMLPAVFLPGSSKLPVNLGYGKKATFLMMQDFEYRIAEYLIEYCDGVADSLEVCISTTTENFVCRADAAMKSRIDSCISKVRVQV
jgi:hypothetical protein